ncbi:MAG TPA: ABC transporter ATP-binding protein [Pseudogracilibacillus sp.]|nr:ABC transporter ATP-binding protein [Pseudogracilibacillus sp.]
MAEAIIEIDALTKEYDDVTAVNDLSLTIERGEVFGLLGPNGAGKSTTILTLLGLSEPTAGSVRVCGVDSTRNPLAVKEKVGYLPDDLGFYDHMTGEENIVYTAMLNGISKRVARERAHELLDQMQLLDAKDKKVATYSRGMRQRLGLADVLIKEPDVIILDEPTLGIDPKGVTELLAFIRKLNERDGLTVLLSSHHLHQVQQICDRVGLFVKGELLAVGDVTSLAEQLFVERSYIFALEVEPLTPEFLHAVKNCSGISSVETVRNEVHIESSKDISQQLVKLISEHDVVLRYLQRKEDDLDTIYQRYFAGSDTDA